MVIHIMKTAKRTRRERVSLNLIKGAMKKWNLDVLMMCGVPSPLSSSLFVKAARWLKGRQLIQSFELLLDNQCKWNIDVAARIAHKGNPEALHFMCERGHYIDPERIAIIFGEQGNYKEFQWALDILNRHDEICEAAVTGNQLAILQLAVSRGMRVTDSAVELAIQKGNKEIIEWILTIAKKNESI